MDIKKLTTESTLKEWRETINLIIDALQVASSTNDGFMSSSDKNKLDNIDLQPTEQSSNLVESGGVYSFIMNEISKINNNTESKN